MTHMLLHGGEEPGRDYNETQLNNKTHFTLWYDTSIHKHKKTWLFVHRGMVVVTCLIIGIQVQPFLELMLVRANERLGA